jgi:hypothetical protein
MQIRSPRPYGDSRHFHPPADASRGDAVDIQVHLRPVHIDSGDMQGPTFSVHAPNRSFEMTPTVDNVGFGFEEIEDLMSAQGSMRLERGRPRLRAWERRLATKCRRLKMGKGKVWTLDWPTHFRPGCWQMTFARAKAAALLIEIAALAPGIATCLSLGRTQIPR